MLATPTRFRSDQIRDRYLNTFEEEDDFVLWLKHNFTTHKYKNTYTYTLTKEVSPLHTLNECMGAHLLYEYV